MSARKTPSNVGAVVLAFVLLSAALGGCGRDLENVRTNPAVSMTVQGIVVTGPVCPEVETTAPGECHVRPLRNSTVKFRNDQGKLTLSVPTNEAGTFTVILPVGRYTAEASDVGNPLQPATTVSFDVPLPDGGLLMLRVDTGVR